MPQVVVSIHLIPVFEVVKKRFRVFKQHINLLAILCVRSLCHTFVATSLKSTIRGHKLHDIVFFFHAEEDKSVPA
jgi:hypothetical protein